MRGIVLTIACCLASTLAFAQAEYVPPKDIAPDSRKCPASGHAPPVIDYGPPAYELAGICTPQVVRDAAVAIGMGRNRPIGIKNIITFRFYANGTLANDSGQIEKVSNLKAHISYVLPAMRMQIEGATAAGAPFKAVRTFSGHRAWNETAPGVGASAAPGAASGRAALVKLTPVGALWSVIEAEGTVKITKAGGRTVLTGASPQDNVPVSVTLDEKNRPIAVSFTQDGKRYAATFSDYRPEAPPYMVHFPARMVWTRDGAPLADLTVTEFRSNPYAIFPIPDAAK